MMGWGAAIMVAVTMLAAITLLPALLGVAGRRVDSLKIPFVRRRTADDGAPSRPAGSLVSCATRSVLGWAATLVLVALAIPAFSMRLGFADAGNDPTYTTTRKAYDLMAEADGPGTNGPFWVVLENQEGTVERRPRQPRRRSREPDRWSRLGDAAGLQRRPETGRPSW